ncbi:MAG: tetratricopeptide repeat protein [Flavobacteriales bacterium]|nr:tetratricopeptide repeat protein [Flavobacteriales bacterium]
MKTLVITLLSLIWLLWQPSLVFCAPADSIQIQEDIDHFEKLLYQSPDEAENLARQITSSSRQVNYKSGTAVGYTYLAYSQIYLSKFDSAEYHIQEALKVCQKYNLGKEKMEAYHVYGHYYFYKSDPDRALEMYLKALKIAEEKYPQSSAVYNASVGLIFQNMSNYAKAETYLVKAHQLATVYKDSSTLMFVLNNRGIIAKNEGRYEDAIQLYEEGLVYANALSNPRRKSELLQNLSSVYNRMGHHDKGLELLVESIEISEPFSNNRDHAINYHNLAYSYFDVGYYDKALEANTKAFKYGEMAQFKEVLTESYGLRAELYAAKGNYKKAYDDMFIYYTLTDSQYLDRLNNAALKYESQFLLEKENLQDSLEHAKSQEITELQISNEKKINRQKVKSRESLLWASGIALIIVIIGIYFLFSQNRKVKSQNEIISQKNDEVRHQKAELEEQHKEITDSIHYAERIQKALLSTEEEWNRISPQNTIFFRPKDVVSGDFYWAHHLVNENISVWAAADCTGHGVPGAFMSMLGIGFLNEIVVENKIASPSEILNQLRDKIIKALRQKDSIESQKDGMDIGLCVWNKNTNELEFCGANNPLWIIREQNQLKEQQDYKIAFSNENFSLIELQANKMPVGFHTSKNVPFIAQKIQLKPNDQIITFSDGYPDQFGGPKGKKLKYKAFKQTLLNLASLEPPYYQEQLKRAFDQWKGSFEQTDDVCVINIRV